MGLEYQTSINVQLKIDRGSDLKKSTRANLPMLEGLNWPLCLVLVMFLDVLFL